MANELTRTLTIERLKDVVSYDPETGHFTWLRRIAKIVKPGGQAGSPHRTGYRYLQIDGERIAEHRLAYFYMIGEWPQEVDHRNLDKTDNRWNNLRAASISNNRWNRTIQSNNTSGYKGVSYHKTYRRWTAYIGYRGSVISLGRFGTAESAAAAYAEAADRLHGDFARIK